jgi:hypothetical protein
MRLSLTPCIAILGILVHHAEASRTKLVLTDSRDVHLHFSYVVLNGSLRDYGPPRNFLGL